MFFLFLFKQSVNKIGGTNYYTNFVTNLHVNSCPYAILGRRLRIKTSRSDLKQQTQLGKITLKIGIRIRGKRRVRYTAGNDCRHPITTFIHELMFILEKSSCISWYILIRNTRPKRRERII